MVMPNLKENAREDLNFYKPWKYKNIIFTRKGTITMKRITNALSIMTL